VPPHAQIAVLSWEASCISKEKVVISKADVDQLAGLGVEVLTKVSDPKIKAACVEMMTALLMREKKQTGGKDGPVAKSLHVLTESKDSGAKLLYKKIFEGADPEAAAKAEADKVRHSTYPFLQIDFSST